MCQELGRLLRGKTRRMHAQRAKRQRIERVLVYAECRHGLPIYYFYEVESGFSAVRYNRRNWQRQTDFLEWPEEVKDFIAGGGYK